MSDSLAGRGHESGRDDAHRDGHRDDASGAPVADAVVRFRVQGSTIAVGQMHDRRNAPVLP